MADIPEKLRESLKPITLIGGHYGVGKTNFTCNLATDLAHRGKRPTVADLDIVNPYFRATEQRAYLADANVALIAPSFAEAGTSLDVPSLKGSLEPAFGKASKDFPVLVDLGGDDAGTVALGRFKPMLASHSYAFLGVINGFRNLIQTPVDAAENLKEIEACSGLKLTGLVSNAHLQEDTTAEVIYKGYEYALEVSRLLNIPLSAVTFPATISLVQGIPNDLLYGLQIIVKAPWR